MPQNPQCRILGCAFADPALPDGGRQRGEKPTRRGNVEQFSEAGSIQRGARCGIAQAIEQFEFANRSIFSSRLITG